VHGENEPSRQWARFPNIRPSEKQVAKAMTNVNTGKAGAWDGVSDLIFKTGGKCCKEKECVRCRNRRTAASELVKAEYWEN
jgi:hypothetical protein